MAIPRTGSGISISSARARRSQGCAAISPSGGCWRSAPREAAMSGDFTPEQKRYLEGFVSGLSAARSARGSAPAKPEPTGPDAVHIEAQDRVMAAGGKLADQEKFKREQHPFDA